MQELKFEQVEEVSGGARMLLIGYTFGKIMDAIIDANHPDNYKNPCEGMSAQDCVDNVTQNDSSGML
ncbi:hypothetical protein [Aliidiomarina sp.]|uniref:hypothetical protein n=1 Tax=Aliidiomarina sp. TaxID=1872439 RepID=UPI003A4D568A